MRMLKNHKKESYAHFSKRQVSCFFLGKGLEDPGGEIQFAGSITSVAYHQKGAICICAVFYALQRNRNK